MENRSGIPSTASTSSTPASKPVAANKKMNKKIMIAAIAVGIIVLLGIVGFVLASRNATANQNNQANNQNQNQQGTGNPDGDQMGNYLPAEICPEKIFNSNSQGEYEGKTYDIRSELLPWILQTCGGITVGVQDPNMGSQSEDEPPLKVKNLGFNLDFYDEATNSAGDIKFTKTGIQFDQIYGVYGQQDPRTTDPTKINPQPTVILPLGTKVMATVDGVVSELKEIYSGDYTIWLSASNTSEWFYEIEHVDNPLVAKGDRVTAGQVIAEVSKHDSQNHPGFGVVEFGLFHSFNNRPQHVCLYKYLDLSIEADVNAKLMDFYAAWNKYIGKEVYKQATFETPGCVTTAPFNE